MIPIHASPGVPFIAALCDEWAATNLLSAHGEAEIGVKHSKPEVSRKKREKGREVHNFRETVAKWLTKTSIGAKSSIFPA